MSVKSDSLAQEGTPRYLANGDPALCRLLPLWLDNWLTTVTVEGSMLDGAVSGAEPSGPSWSVSAGDGDSHQFHSVGRLRLTT